MGKTFLHQIFWRLLLGAFTIVIVVVITFLLMRFAPGDPIDAFVGDYPIPAAYREELIERLALDKSTTEQLVSYLLSIFRGELGYSFRLEKQVSEAIKERLFATALLMGTTLVFATLVGVFIGIVAGHKVGSPLDNFVMGVAAALYSMPVFILGLLLLIVFGFYLRWFPLGGMETSAIYAKTGLARVLDIVKHLTLPALALSGRYIALLARVTRASILEVSGENYVTAGKAKGLSQMTILMKYILRNCLIPIVTVIGLNFAFLLTGSAVLETVFGWPGMGTLMYESLKARDFQVLQAIFIMATIVVILVNIIIDIIYTVIDPRVSGLTGGRGR